MRPASDKHARQGISIDLRALHWSWKPRNRNSQLKLIRTVSIGASAVSTKSWLVDTDVLIQGASASAALTFCVSLNPSYTTAFILVPGNTQFNDLIMVGANSGVGACQGAPIGVLAFPVSKGETVYVAFSAAGLVTLYLDDLISAEISTK
jgi:hypothetical protein